MADVDVPLSRLSWGKTQRKDNWWITPLVVFTILSSFLVYATIRAFANVDYHYTGGGADYLSPMYSPTLFGPDSFFGAKPAWIPAWVPFTPALLILPFPAGFRLTCYYYRGAYYKAFWADPPSCAVGEPRTGYRGEQKLPLIVQNLHRYFLYFALIFIIFLAHDAWRAMWFVGADGHKHFGISLGTLVLTANVLGLSSYTFGCHSLRHLVGGFLDTMSRHPVRKKAYDCVSCFNRWHMRWAWTSLLVVAFSDVYVSLLCKGIWHDWRLF